MHAQIKVTSVQEFWYKFVISIVCALPARAALT